MKIKINELFAIDVETTGLDPEINRICEISILKIKNNNLDEIFTTFINPETKIPINISNLTGIRDIDLENAPKFKEVAEKIYNLINQKILLCHNANFDISFLKKEFERSGYKLPEIKIIDTYIIAKKFFKFKKNSLQSISKFYKIKGTEHRAEDDAKKTFEIFKIFCRQLEKKYRSFSLNSLFLFKYQKNFFLKRIIFDINQIENKIYLDKDILEKIEKALNEQREILIKYINKKKEITERKILPIEIINENGVKYLIGFCKLRGEERKFRIDRIKKII